MVKGSISHSFAKLLTPVPQDFLKICMNFQCHANCLVGLVVKAPTSRAEDPGSNPACAEIFPGSSNTSDLKIGTPVATQADTWRYRVSTGTGLPGVSIL